MYQKKFKLLKPKNDIVFQSLFNQSNERITKSFIESLLQKKIYKMQINETKELYRDKPDDKLGILDLELDINDNEKIDVEVQMVNNENFADRLLFYFAKLYATSLKIGDDYILSKRTVIISILGDNLKLTEKVKEIETKWKLMCKEHPELELTNKLEIIIIELKKVRENYHKNKNDTKYQWLMFLDNPDSKEVKEIMKKNEEIKEAIITVHKMSEDEKMQKLADLRQKYIMDQKAIYRTGLHEGEKNGKEIGKKEEKIEIAKKLIKLGFPLEKTAKATGLSIENLKNLD